MGTLDDDIKKDRTDIDDLTVAIKEVQKQPWPLSFKKQRIRELAQFRKVIKDHLKTLEDAKKS